MIGYSLNEILIIMALRISSECGLEWVTDINSLRKLMPQLHIRIETYYPKVILTIV
jgi:hypothetical protein